MKPSETEKIYVTQCNIRRIKPQKDEKGVSHEGLEWHKVLQHFSAVDVEAACDMWRKDTTPGSDGQPRGKWLPSMTELKPLVERCERAHLAAIAEPTDFVGWRCPTCKYTFSGWTNVTTTRFCPRCGKNAEEIHRERAA